MQQQRPNPDKSQSINQLINLFKKKEREKGKMGLRSSGQKSRKKKAGHLCHLAVI